MSTIEQRAAEKKAEQALVAKIETTFESLGRPLNNEDVKALLSADECKNLNVHQLRGKVVHLGYYQKAVAKSVGTGDAPVTRKIEFVNAIETMLNKEKGSLASFEKASKPQLEAMANALIALSDTKEAEE